MIKTETETYSFNVIDVQKGRTNNVAVTIFPDGGVLLSNRDVTIDQLKEIIRKNEESGFDV